MLKMTLQEELDMEREIEREHYRAFEYIAEMVGLDTSKDPQEGIWDVVLAVEAFVKKAGGGCTLDEARERCGAHWLDEQKLRKAPDQSRHGLAVDAYFAALRGAPADVR